jgi:N6-L-threonylcarbamoyladenine synthase
MILLTIETTCDETAAAVVTDSLEVLGSAVATQDRLHERFSGVVPEIAARAHVERILPVIDLALSRANRTLRQIDAIAVANSPGLAGSLVIGLVAAKSLCVALGVPLLALNHIHAHIYACRLSARRNVFPCIGMVVSGGHSSLFDCRSALDFRLIGSTIDDAAGEAFDKVASMLSLPYPGGPAVARAAQRGNPNAFRFPRPFISDTDRLDFSFSGLKTAVRYALAGPGRVDFDVLSLPESTVADVAASFQEAVVDCLAAKALLAIERTSYRRLCVGGGVAANQRLRERLHDEAEAAGIELHIAPLELCTDNAVMGAIAIEKLKAGQTQSLDLDAVPGMIRR